MLGSVSGIGRFVDDFRLRETGIDVSYTAVEFEQDVSARTLDTRLRTLVMKNGRTDPHRFLGIENGRQQFIVHLQAAASLLRGPLAVCQHGGYPLSDMANHVVQNIGIVRIGVIIIMGGAGKQQARGRLPQVKTAWTPGTASARSLRMR